MASNSINKGQPELCVDWYRVTADSREIWNMVTVTIDEEVSTKATSLGKGRIEGRQDFMSPCSDEDDEGREGAYAPR